MTKMAKPSVRLWLMQQPRPKAVRVKCSDGEVRLVEMSPERTWTDHAKTIASLGAVRLEALTADGAVLRATDTMDLESSEAAAATPNDEDVDEPTLAAAAAAANGDPAVLMPMGAVVRLLITIARLLADAHSQRTDVAFNRLVSLFDAVAEQSRNSQRQLEQLRAQLESNAGKPKKSGGLDDIMMAAFLNGQGAGAQAAVASVMPGVAATEAPAPTNGTSNGAGGFDKLVDRFIDRFMTRMQVSLAPEEPDDDDDKPEPETPEE